MGAPAFLVLRVPVPLVFLVVTAPDVGAPVLVPEMPFGTDVTAEGPDAKSSRCTLRMSFGS